jgi:hypothetical protein
MPDKNMRYGILLLFLSILIPVLCLADIADISTLESDSRVAAAIGYRWVDTDGNAGRAAEYSFLDASETFNFTYQQDPGVRHFSLTGVYNNEHDYDFAGDFDYKALFRLSARTERLYHNLDHIPYNAAQMDARPATSAISYEDHDLNAVYGRSITIDEVKVRGKLPTYPAHVNLEFWRMEKKGQEQLRFVSENCAEKCHMQSTTRLTDRVTEEIKAEFDAHLGPMDIAFLQTLRESREKAANPSDLFGLNFLGRPPGPYDHDVTPDSKLSESTFTMNLPPSGGFVTSASYTLGNRRKHSSITGVTPTSAETDYQKLAADVTYTPGEKWTVNFRYRMLELDTTGPATQTTTGSTTFSGLIPVRESVDIDRNNYTVYISYRPTRRITLKGEFEREDTTRSHTGIGSHVSFGPGTANLVWNLPEDEKTDRFRLSFFSRMFEKSALKFNGWYEHVKVDNPAYGTTLTNSDEVFFSASYRPSPYWGVTSSLDILHGNGVNRKKASENLALGGWYILNEIFSADINYGLINTQLDEGLLFGDIASDADYEQRVHTLSAGVNLRPMDKLNCRLEGYLIRSEASFDPYFADDLSIPATADDLEGISKVDIRQNGLKARVRWKLTEMLTAGIEYTFDDYDDRDSSVFDGTAQTVMASLAGVF